MFDDAFYRRLLDQQAEQFRVINQVIASAQPALNWYDNTKRQLDWLKTAYGQPRWLWEGLSTTYLKSLTEAMNAFAKQAQVIETARLQVVESWVPLLGEANRLWDALEPTLRALRDLSPELVERLNVYEAFEAAELVVVPSMSKVLVKNVVKSYLAGSAPEDLCDLVSAYYDENDGQHLKDVVEELCTPPDFAGRQQTLRDALAAHLAHLDTITLYPLVAMVEGVTIPFFVDALNRKSLKHHEIPEALDEMPTDVAHAVGFEGYAVLVTYMENKLYSFSNWTTDSSVRRNYIDLNRHRLLHGMVNQGTRINSLRCFLRLELLGKILPAVRAELAVRGSP